MYILKSKLLSFDLILILRHEELLETFHTLYCRTLRRYPNSINYVASGDCAAVDVLPKNLKTLVIFQADVDSCDWV